LALAPCRFDGDLVALFLADTLVARLAGFSFFFMEASVSVMRLASLEVKRE
jgi:hypothetical protein